MRNRSKLVISILGAVLVFLAACQKSEKANPHAEAPPVLSSNGQERGNGGETMDPSRGSAWFAEKTKYSKSENEENKTVNYCINVSTDFPIEESVLKQKVKAAILHWTSYLKTHRVFEGATEKRLTLNWEEASSCHEKNVDISFLFGESNEALNGSIKQMNQPWSIALRTNYDAENTWGRGFIWFAKNAVYSDKNGQKYPNWNLSYAIDGLLLHELGHVFGAGHINGTIMEESITDTVKNLYLDNEARRKNRLTKIDQEFDLIPCLNCSSEDFGYSGKLGDSNSEINLFLKLMGREPRGVIKSLILMGPSRYQLVLNDDEGSEAFALENPIGDDTPDDVYVPPSSRIQISQLVSNHSTGSANWELSRVLSRSGTFERTIKLHDGNVIPVKLVLNQIPSLKTTVGEVLLPSYRASLIWKYQGQTKILFQTVY